MILLGVERNRNSIQRDSVLRFAIGLIALFSLIAVFRIDLGFENARYFQIVGIGLSIASALILSKRRRISVLFAVALPFVITYLSFVVISIPGISAEYSGPELLTQSSEFSLMGFRQPLLEGIRLKIARPAPRAASIDWYARYSPHSAAIKPSSH